MVLQENDAVSDPDAGLRGCEKLSAVNTNFKCRWADQWDVSKESCLHETTPLCDECGLLEAFTRNMCNVPDK
jgi:hypothetical protein